MIAVGKESMNPVVVKDETSCTGIGLSQYFFKELDKQMLFESFGFKIEFSRDHYSSDFLSSYL